MDADNTAIIGQVSGGVDLSFGEMSRVVGDLMQGGWADDEIALLLNALRIKGETVEEVAGAAAAMRRKMTPIRSSRSGVVDTCGTGGDGSGTFNISTAAALVTAAAGAPVAKHGNRSITSKTGSADVLAALGVNIEASVPLVERCLEEVGICFCFAPQLHPSMKHVAAARRKLGVPTIFNMLGPLCNPAAAPFQLLGVGRANLRELLSSALVLLDTQRAVVVCGEDGLDEVTLSGVTKVTEVRGASRTEFTWHPADFGLEVAGNESLLVAGPQDSARMIQGVLDGQSGPPRDIVLLNAAAALWAAGIENDLKAGVKRSAAAIDSGAARELVARLVKVSHS